MGKKKIERIEKIQNQNQRKVTYCKRKKGLLKKTMELSLLCDQVCFLYILDKNQGRVIHFASHPDENILDMFNKGYTREFYTNDDYDKVGGIKVDSLDNPQELNAINKDEGTCQSAESQKEGAHIDSAVRHALPNDANKAFSLKHQKYTSRVGNIEMQKQALPQNMTQTVSLEKIVKDVEEAQKEVILEIDSSVSHGVKGPKIKTLPKLKEKTVPKILSQVEQIQKVSTTSKECQTITTVREMDNVNAYFMKAINAMNSMRQHARSGYEYNIKHALIQNSYVQAQNRLHIYHQQKQEYTNEIGMNKPVQNQYNFGVTQQELNANKFTQINSQVNQFAPNQINVGHKRTLQETSFIKPSSFGKKISDQLKSFSRQKTMENLSGSLQSTDQMKLFQRQHQFQQFKENFGSTITLNQLKNSQMNTKQPNMLSNQVVDLKNISTLETSKPQIQGEWSGGQAALDLIRGKSAKYALQVLNSSQQAQLNAASITNQLQKQQPPQIELSLKSCQEEREDDQQ